MSGKVYQNRRSNLIQLYRIVIMHTGNSDSVALILQMKPDCLVSHTACDVARQDVHWDANACYYYSNGFDSISVIIQPKTLQLSVTIIFHSIIFICCNDVDTEHTSPHKPINLMITSCMVEYFQQLLVFLLKKITQKCTHQGAQEVPLTATAGV